MHIVTVSADLGVKVAGRDAEIAACATLPQL